MKKLFALMAVCLLALVTGCGSQNAAETKSSSSSQEPVELHVSAAASLTDVMNEIGAEYEKEHPNVKVVFNYGSSGALQQAIENGGNADLFFSAAQKQMDALDKKGLLADGTRKDLLQNEVVLIVPKEGGKDITSLDQLTSDRLQHIALGEPKGVPVGQYSEEILKKLGMMLSRPKPSMARMSVRSSPGLLRVKPMPALFTRRMLPSRRTSALSPRPRLARTRTSSIRLPSSKTQNIWTRQRIS